MIELKLHIPGKPGHKQSMKQAYVPCKVQENGKISKGFIHDYQTDEVKDVERNIRYAVSQQMPAGFACHTGPVAVSELFYGFALIKSAKKWQKEWVAQSLVVPKVTKPDVTDNLAKALFDAMQSVVYVNDSQIFYLGDVIKCYVINPGILITLLLFSDEKEAAVFVNKKLNLVLQLEI